MDCDYILQRKRICAHLKHTRRKPKNGLSPDGIDRLNRRVPQQLRVMLGSFIEPSLKMKRTGQARLSQFGIRIGLERKPAPRILDRYEEEECCQNKTGQVQA